MNIRTADGKAIKPPEDLAIRPIADERTDAFQANMKMAPEPNKKENRNVSVNTLELLTNISTNLLPISSYQVNLVYLIRKNCLHYLLG